MFARPVVPKFEGDINGCSVGVGDDGIPKQVSGVES
jgi:hypothetical protein